MKTLFASIVLAILSNTICFADEYSDCILDNMKGVNDRFAAAQIRLACREKALPYVPAKCSVLFEANVNSLYYNSSKGKCIDNCLNASYWSKHFGECKE